jgi:hypothetical protein
MRSCTARIGVLASVVTMAKLRTTSSPSPRQCSQMPAKAMPAPERGATAAGCLPPASAFHS